MNLPRVATAAVAAWVVYFVISLIAHHVLLASLYAEHAMVMRPHDGQLSILPVGLAMAFVGFFAFAYAYAKGYEGGNGLQEGLRFGVLVGILICCFSVVFEYMAWPVSPRLFAAWVVEYIVEFAIYGALVGLVYRPRAIGRRTSAAI